MLETIKQKRLKKIRPNLSKLKKGDKIEINGKEYLVEDFNINTQYNEKTGDKSGTKEIILIKKGDDSKGFLKQRYTIKYNEKTKEFKLVKLSEEKEISPKGFKYQSTQIFAGYKRG